METNKVELETKPVSETEVSLDRSLQLDMNTVEKGAKSALKMDGEEPVIANGKEKQAVDLLAYVRQLVRDVDAQYKIRVAPVMAKLKGIENQRKGIKAKAALVEEQLVSAFKTMWREGNLTTEGMDGRIGGKLSVIEKQYLVVTSARHIPDQFLKDRIDCIDLNKVMEHYEATGKLPPGVKLEKDVQFRAVMAQEIDV